MVRHDVELRLARLVISCCAADARPMTVRLVGSGLDYPPDTWLQVRGQLQPGSATAETRYVPALTVSDAAGGTGARRIPTSSDALVHSAHTPKISTVWLIWENPCSSATRSAQRSTAGPSTSTVRPHCRQTRW